MKTRNSRGSRISIRLLALVLMPLGLLAIRQLTQAQPASQTPAPIFVDAAVVGGLQNGSSWGNATPSLDYAIAHAMSGGELWCATGTYTPASATTGFLITKQLRLYGGFLGPHDALNPSYPGESQVSERRGSAKLTVLNGEILTPSHTDNVNHVVSIDTVASSNGNPGVLIDGFRIKDGQGGPLLGLDGAGIWCHCTDLDLNNVYFDHNYAFDGGAIWFEGCVVTPPPPVGPTPLNILRVKSCEFFDNHADHYGGAIFADTLSGWVVNSKFMTNLANPFGGGAYVKHVQSNKSFDFTNCVFWENYCTGVTTALGGALYFDQASSGAGDYSISQVVNCTFSGNFIAQCVAGQAMHVSANSLVGVYNSILFWNKDLVSNGCGTTLPPISGLPTVEYSDVQLAFTGSNNLNVDPKFMATTPSGPPPTSFTGGGPPPTAVLPDLSLRRAGTGIAGSECIDYGDLTRVPADVADLDEDGDLTERLPLDLLEAPRRVDRHQPGEDTPTGVDFIDRGCYERP